MRCFISSQDASSSGSWVTWNRIIWLLSVLVCSVALSSARDFLLLDEQKSGMFTSGLLHQVSKIYH